MSFELGTDPDIDTVNVNNRVQVALSKLPQDVQKQGVTVKKQSSALLGVIALYSPKQTHDELFISNSWIGIMPAATVDGRGMRSMEVGEKLRDGLERVILAQTGG